MLGDHKSTLHPARKDRNRHVFYIFVLLLPLAAPASGQTLPAPGALQVSPIPRLTPPQTPRVEPGLQGLPSGPLTNTAPEQPVAVSGVSVEGVTVYPAAEMDALVAGLVGPAVPLRQIEDRRLALVRKYRDGGYPLVSVQATRSADGRLRFVVFEGHIAEVKLDGDIGPAGTQVLRFLQRLTETQPIDAASLERWLLLAQDVPGITLQGVLRPSDAEPGALTLIAKVQRTAVSGVLSADNRAYQLTGPQEGLAILDLNSFTSLGERTELNLFTTFSSAQIFGQASTEMFVGSSGLRVRLYAGAGNTTPTGFLHQVGYNGDTTVAGVQVSYPLIRARQQTLNLVANFDALDLVVDTAPPGAPSTVGSKDSVRVLRIGGDYALQDLLAGETRPAVNGMALHLSQGLASLGASVNTSVPARVGEDLGFTKVAGEISRNQTLFAPWSGATVSLLGLAAGQGSGDVLPPVEKFFLGGSRYTRGYYLGEVSGDSGVALTGELQLTTSYNVVAFGKTIDIGTQYDLFYDYGQAWENQKTEPNATLRSTGLGVRVSMSQYLDVDLEGVRRFTLTSDGPNTSKLQEYAFYFGVIARY